MKKILIALGIFLCIVLIVTIANCSGDDDDITDTNADTAPTPSPIWTLKDFKDEFNNPTGEKYLQATVSGTFDNLMGEDQKLKADIQVKTNDVFIVLYEYESDQLEAILGNTPFMVTVLDQNNTKHTFSAYLNDGAPYLDFSNYGWYEKPEALIEILKAPGTVSFYIENQDDKDNTYSFSVKTDGFADLYKQIVSAEEPQN